ncbi:MAG: energy-coupled thiamine transporter ThiT [Lachnospiraceae bacterium]|nr:energy-coupled thiamine transporter ThiT [Lachnospiraceae bacterium]
MNSTSNSKKITEASVMLATATVLSLAKLIDLPYGGSVTIACMLPIIIISYRHGIKWGLMTGLVFGVIQQLLGINTLSYATGWVSAVAIILLDYCVAFMVAGFGGIFRKKLSQPRALMFGALLICFLRFICHVITGVTVWRDISIPGTAAFIYSLSYNATYMIPETIVTMLCGYYIGSLLDFSGEDLKRYNAGENERISTYKWLAGILIVAGLILDTKMVFSKLQNGDSGEFDITGLSQVNWLPVIIITAGVILAVITLLIVSAVNKRQEKTKQ